MPAPTALETTELKVKEAESKVGSPRLYENQMREKVVPSGRHFDQNYTIHEATPITPETPVRNSAELKQTKAYVVNDGIEDSSLIANVENALKIGKSKFTGESVWARFVNGLKGLKIWNRRKGEQAKMKPEDYKPDSDMGGE